MKNVKKDEAVDEAISFDELDQYAGGLGFDTRDNKAVGTSKNLIEKLLEKQKNNPEGNPSADGNK